ncbi:MAG: aminopeptidase N [Pseudomonadota bacterium]
MRPDTPPKNPTRLANYQPYDFIIDAVALDFDLDPESTTVTSTLNVRRREGVDPQAPLVLDGEEISLVSIRLDDNPLAPDRYQLDENTLTIKDLPNKFTLHIVNTCSPATNTSLSGLYVSNDMFCTQCEAEGFRRITYYPDRPDVMSVFTVRIDADKKRYPVLLSNGNPGETGETTKTGETKDGKHFAIWHDPHPKPAYLFALVAGDLACVEDHFVTRSGKQIPLRVFVQHKNKDRCDFTLDALKRSMKWEEDVYGLEYDLDVFMIVAVDHFNMGAMENKGLNIFNSAYVLASPDTATDADYEIIEAIVAHEYFHNWSGNRVTLRDWFQLCLKEGFTVFRDQEFSADMRSRSVQRIKDVRRLWASQFPEDAGPLAHPPRPDHFYTIDNFYTTTVYEKGAEVVRMLKTLLGEDVFLKSCDQYFERHDGEAATIEDFAKVMEDISGRDLTLFRNWWTRPGTPHVTVSEGTLGPEGGTVELKQETSTTTAGIDAEPRHIPVGYALVGASTGDVRGTGLIELTEASQTIEIKPDTPADDGSNEPLIVSWLTDFSAPVVLSSNQSLDDRLTLAAHDPDPFNRWSVVDGLWRDLCQTAAGYNRGIDEEEALNGLCAALDRSVLAALDALEGTRGVQGAIDASFVAQLLAAPSASDLTRGLDGFDPAAIVDGRSKIRRVTAERIGGTLLSAYERLTSDAPYEPSAEASGQRGLKNAALGLLVEAGRADLAEAQGLSSRNMTDEAAAAAILATSEHPDAVPAREKVLGAFYDKWKDDALVVNKWLGWNAQQPDANALSHVQRLAEHKSFDIKTPNKVRALFGVFSNANLKGFNAEDGEGYRFIAEQISRVDSLNAQLAARMTSAFEPWPRLKQPLRSLAQNALASILDREPSTNLKEMVERLLKE